MLTVSHLTGVTPRSEKDVNMFEAESTVGYKLCFAGDLVINGHKRTSGWKVKAGDRVAGEIPDLEWLTLHHAFCFISYKMTDFQKYVAEEDKKGSFKEFDEANG